MLLLFYGLVVGKNTLCVQLLVMRNISLQKRYYGHVVHVAFFGDVTRNAYCERSDFFITAQTLWVSRHLSVVSASWYVHNFWLLKTNTKLSLQSRSSENALWGQESSPAALKFGSESKEFKLELARSEKAGLPGDVPWKCQLTHNIMRTITSNSCCVVLHLYAVFWKSWGFCSVRPRYQDNLSSISAFKKN